MRKRDDSHSRIDCQRPLDEHQAICAQAAKLPKACSYWLLGKCWQKLDTSTFDFLMFSEIASKGVLKAPVCSKEPSVFVYLKGAWAQYFSPQKSLQVTLQAAYRSLTGHELVGTNLW